MTANHPERRPAHLNRAMIRTMVQMLSWPKTEEMINTNNNVGMTMIMSAVLNEDRIHEFAHISGRHANCRSQDHAHEGG